MSAQVHILNGRATRCGIKLERYDASTWVRYRMFGAQNIILVGDTPSCLRCIKLAQHQANEAA